MYCEKCNRKLNQISFIDNYLNKYSILKCDNCNLEFIDGKDMNWQDFNWFKSVIGNRKIINNI